MPKKVDSMGSKSYDDLLSRSEGLKRALESGVVNLSQAETESIKLNALYNNLCSKQASTFNSKWDSSCDKALSNIQSASVSIRDAKTRS